MKIKTKLVLFFLLVKVIPVLFIFYIAIKGAEELNIYIKEHISQTSNTNSKILEETTDSALTDTIKYLDKKSQESLEKMTYQISTNIANFLYERDKDLIFLSSLQLDDKTLKSFYDSKFLNVIVSPEYFYDEKKSIWIEKNRLEKKLREKDSSNLKDNEKEFNFVDPIDYNYTKKAIYKEISFFDLNGNEKYKYSKINENKLNVFNKENTYLKAEDYKDEIEKLKKGEIYVSEVIGEYVPSKIIGTFTKEKALKNNIEFKPENYGFAGKENPLGKKFDGIIRFITPIFNNNEKIGFLSFALDHYHIMEFSDKINPVSAEVKQAIADASVGNYAFIWDNLGRSISHPRDYFIVGFDKKTGKRVMPWLEFNLAQKFKKSGKEINEFLEDYPTFENQSLKKKPNLEQLKLDGNVGLDCRYLNFAPQCEGWMQLTQNGGYGSFIIFWSNVWKLTTAAAIPYYTGNYGKSKRGFGFVTIGANVDEFHAAADKTKEKIKSIVNEQKNVLEANKSKSEEIISYYLKQLINQLSVSTVIMIIIVILLAIWMSNFISRKIQNLLIGTKYFSEGNLDYQIEESSKDEIGQLEKSFNNMNKKIKLLINEQKVLNESLEKKVQEELQKNLEKEQKLAQQSKLASMGEMIANIAHQWRQPLSVISTSISGVKVNLEFDMLEKEQLERCISNVEKQTNYLSNTIDNFRSFIKGDKASKEISLKEIFDYTSSLLSATLTNSYINLVSLIDNNIIFMGNKNEISEAFINIINNSKDILVSKYKEDEEKIILIESNLINETSFEIKFYDNGLGIDENIIDKVLEPYFTTKHQSIGTGLGLSMVEKIIREKYDGEVYVENKKFEYDGKEYFGACFTLVFNNVIKSKINNDKS